MGRFTKLLGKVVERATGQPSGDSAASGDAADSHPLDPIPSTWNQAIKESPTPEEGLESVIVRFAGSDLEVSVPKGTTLLDAAIEAEADLNHYCGGMCSCGSCRIEVLSGEVSEIDPMEETTLDIVREAETDRLGCQTRALGDLVVRIPAD